jgi:phosphoglycerate dehydrogenase-like enzyme
MKILFTTENGPIKDVYFPSDVLQALGALGELRENPKDTPFTPQELADGLPGSDVCITHWSCPTFTAEVLTRADRLKLIVHAAGSVADLVTDEVYRHGIRVCSANSVMAQSVAEGVLADILCGLRLIPQQAYEMKVQKVWKKRLVESRTLFGAKVGLVGLGTIGRYLIRLLEPFGVQVKVYDPYLQPGAVAEFPNVALASLKEVMAWGDVVSVHASLTPETHGLIDEEKLGWIRDGVLFVNTARGAIVDERALAKALSAGRFRAVLDVYENEPLPEDSPLRECENAILLPHVAGITAREEMSFAMIEEIRRFSQGEPLQHEISHARFQLMTKEH